MDFLWDNGEMAEILQAQHQGNIIFSWAKWQTQESFHVSSSYYTALFFFTSLNRIVKSMQHSRE